MKQACCRYVRVLPLGLLLLLGWSAYLPTHVLATDLPMIGGLNPGGNYLRSECLKGSYLVGLKGKAGAWVDRIATVCAPWLPAQQTFGRTSVGPFFGTSEGGKEISTGCWGSGVRNRAVQSLRYNFEFFKRESRLVLSLIQAHCTSLSPPADTGFLVFGTQYPKYQYMQGPYEGPPPNQACPAGEIAVGIHVRAESFVYFIGLICGPPPSLGALATNVNPLAMKPEVPATKVNPHVTAPTTAATNVNPLGMAPVPDADMFLITRPGNGDRIEQGQLVLAAQPPKIGATPVTVLELKWLDAPPGQSPFSTFAVETPKLLQGYQVDPRMTQGRAGRWEVRARISAQPTPGPWSFPVQFQLFQIQPVQSQQQPSPMVQQAPLPGSSVMQAPAPSGSAATQMRRSPSMIAARGVEEKEASSETPAPTEPAKKP